ncbi:hypothetical protein HUG15_14575 [Salicibibacter cibarius]|uniref:Uncharacterized protein n=1 Tax=Salicibibacter cibarius TaxID=2743000 RepID=A0A7T7CCA5_9BACI|nr:hypothetical protein [Salicibibacter cibarius]QQK76669.1 hypothetical protein HUG15_14575 [Salicibibacter cibarius]
MSRRDWWIAVIIIAVGLHFLCMSGIVSAVHNVPSYFHLLFNICLWMAKPLLGGVIIYMIISFISKRKESEA